VLTSRTMRLVVNVGERRGAYRVLVGKPERKNHMEDLGVDGRIRLKWILKTLNGGEAWIGLT